MARRDEDYAIESQMLADGEDREESQNLLGNFVNKSTNKKVVNHYYKFYNGI